MDLLSMAGEAPSAPRWTISGAKPTVLFVGLDTRRFVASYAKLLARLIEEGFEVHAVVCEHRQIEALKLMGVHVKAVMPIVPGKPWTAMGCMLMVQAYMHSRTFLLCHIMASSWSLVMATMARRAGCWVNVVSADDVFDWFTQTPNNRVVHVLEALGLTDPLMQRWAQWGRQQAAQSVDMALFTNIQSYERIKKQDWLPSSMLKVLSAGAGLDGAAFEILPDRAQARQVMNVQGWKHIVGASPRSAQAAMQLLETIEQVQHHAPEVRWLLDLDAEVVHQTEAFDALASRGLVRFYVPEQVERSPFYYAALDLFLDLEQDPSFPIELLEAASVSCPTMLAHRESTSRMLNDAEHALILQHLHSAAIAQSISRALANPEALVDVGQRARVLLHGRFHRQEAHERLLVLYDSMLQQALRERAGK